MTWTSRFIHAADLYASWSKDPSTKVGAVIVDERSNIIVATGFNGFPRGVDEVQLERWERPTKYRFVEHAERNAIFNAARHRGGTEGCTLFLNWAPDSICEHCARAIIQAGIARVVGPKRTLQECFLLRKGEGREWRKGIEYGLIMLREAGVTLEVFDG